MDNFRRFFKEISLALSLNPGIETISLSLFSPGQADPNLTFNNLFLYYGATLFDIICDYISSKRNYRCMNNTIFKMAKSVVPPPISINATPASFLPDSKQHPPKLMVLSKPDNSIPEL
jgi:hypothetical protein